MSNIEFKDNSMQVKKAIDIAVSAFLHEAAGEILAQTKRHTPVDTGQLKNSWSYYLNNSNNEAIVGNPLENAIWNEFGTGEYAINGDGRKGGWFYEDAKGDGHFTHGKRPNRTFESAYNNTKSKIIKRAEDVFKTKLSG